ncbi:hypothetical protein AMTRI_Chr12g273680 [Amborella trichopoda]
MTKAIISHFQKAFTSEICFTPRLDRVGFKVLPPNLVTLLERNVSMKEHKNAVFSLHGNKALRPYGDHLSSFLLTIYAGCFSLLINNVATSGQFEGFQLLNNRPCVTNLQYADNTLLFCQARGDNVSNIVVFLKCCEVALRLKVNFQKTRVVGINCDDSTVQNLADILEAKVDDFPMTYLGLPISDGRLPVAIWDKVIQRIQTKLDLWKFKYLSLGGRINLIKACLSNLQIYQMSIL